MKLKNNILELENEETQKLEVEIAENYIKNKIDMDSGEFQSGYLDTIVIHYTASTSKKEALNVLQNPKYEVSAHFLIDNDEEATIHQLMPLNKIAWHAGNSELGNRKALNKYSIGIEIVNPGYLTKTDEGHFLTAFNQHIDKNEAVQAKHKNESTARYWHKYGEHQIKNVLYLCFELSKIFKIKHIVGHDEISPGRKQDPGPLFPIEKIRQYVFQLGKVETDNEEEALKRIAYVTAPLLNIRENGDSHATKIAMPLEKGHQVKVLEENDGWYKVETTIEGWVNKSYIE